MRFSTKKLITALIAFGVVDAKKIVDIPFNAAQLESFGKEADELTKREADAKRLAPEFDLKAAAEELGLSKRDEQVPLVVPNEDNMEPGLKFTLMPNIQEGTVAQGLLQLKEISIFSSYVRDMVDLFRRCENTEPEVQDISAADKMLLIFSPSDEAIEALDLKPWAFPTPLTATNNDQDQTTSKNLEFFVDSHVVEVSSVQNSFDKEVQFKSINGNIIQMKNEGGNFKVSLPDVEEWLEVQKIELLSNGAILVIDRTLTWPGRSA